MEVSVSNLTAKAASHDAKIDHLSDTSKLTAISERLDEIRKTVLDLEATAKSHSGMINELAQWTVSFNYVEDDVKENTADLKALRLLHETDLNGMRVSVNKDRTEMEKELNEKIGKLGHVAYAARIFGSLLLIIIGWALGHFIPAFK
jgi:hypothetical protein